MIFGCFCKYYVLINVNIRCDNVCNVMIIGVVKKKLNVVFSVIVIVIFGVKNIVINNGIWDVNVKEVGGIMILGIIIGIMIFILINKVEIVSFWIEFFFIFFFF